MRISLLSLMGMMSAGVLLACGSTDTTGTGGGPGGHSTTIVASSATRGGAYGSGGNFFYSPTPDTVSAGAAVTYQFGSVVHNVHFDIVSNAPDSIPATSNASVVRTFTTAGTYNFHCTIHGFSGTLVAQ